MIRAMTRREFGVRAAEAASVVALASSRGATAADTKTLRFIAQSDLRVLDPIWTTAYITRNMVFDTLFALDAEFTPHPQMVGEYEISSDKLSYRFKLREGLKFHDGEKVRGSAHQPHARTAADGSVRSTTNMTNVSRRRPRSSRRRPRAISAGSSCPRRLRS